MGFKWPRVPAADKCNSHGDCLSFLVQSFDRGALTLMRVLLEGQTTESAVQTLERACGLLGDSCGNLVPSRRGTDDPLKVKTEMAMGSIQAVERGDLRSGEIEFK